MCFFGLKCGPRCLAGQGDWSQHALREPGRHSTEVWDSIRSPVRGFLRKKRCVFSWKKRTCFLGIGKKIGEFFFLVVVIGTFFKLGHFSLKDTWRDIL